MRAAGRRARLHASPARVTTVRVRWSVYVLVSSATGRTYVGIAGDVEARLRQHNGEAKGGAKSTRAFRPWSVVAVFGPYLSRGKAQRIEAAIKRLRGAARLDDAGVRRVVSRAARRRG